MKLKLFLAVVTVCLSNTTMANASITKASIDTPAGASVWAEAIINAVSQLPSIKASEAELEAATFNQRAASKPLFNPELSVAYGNKEDNEYGMEISQTIDWHGKRNARHASAEALRLASQSRHKALKTESLTSVLKALNAQDAAGQIARFADQQAQGLQQLIHVVEQRLEIGDMGLLDAELARLSLSEAFVEAAVADSEYRSAQGEVEAALGKPLLLANPEFHFPPITETHIHDDIIRSLPTVRIAYNEYQAAKKRLAVSKIEQQADPTFSLGAGKDGDKSVFGLSFSVPLHIRNNYSSEVKAARAEENAAQLQFFDAKRLAMIQLKTSSGQYQRLHDRWLSWKTLTSGRFQQSKDLLNKLWESGDITTADYVFGLQQRMQALHAGIEFERELMDAWVVWLSTSGQIESWLQERITGS